ncbi:thioesterase II family protein [Streptomyces sp. NPDC092952]|uniref:thioesterase II family protein n=1 Tax=Streptomyces sp. NPDC092952 TaxID=3366018 RepID=UPI00381EEF78
MDNWIRCFHPAPEAGAQLVCFPHAGGAASGYHALSAALAGSVEGLVVQYPGRHDRLAEPFAERLGDVVDAVLPLIPVDEGRPLFLFGHSMGALLAYETARRLTAEGRGPAVLFVSGSEAPARPRHTRLNGSCTDQELIDEMRLLSGTDGELLTHPEILKLSLPPLRADYAMLSARVHVPGPPLSCPVFMLTGDNDPRVGMEGAQEWERETEGAFERHVLSGGHFFLNDHLTYIAELITAQVPGRTVPTGA